MICFLQNYWEAIVSVLALLVSVWSTYFAHITFRDQRRHNIKSVKPIIQVGSFDYEHTITIDIRNSGLGVALIKEIVVLNNNKERKGSIYEWLPKTLENGLKYTEYFTSTKDFSVAAGQLIKLLEIEITTLSPGAIQQLESIRTFLHQLTIEISYDDIYDNKMDHKVIGVLGSSSSRY